MNKIFRLLIILLIVELSLGYVIYIKDSTLLTGHYISSTLRALIKANKILQYKITKQNQETNLSVESEKIIQIEKSEEINKEIKKIKKNRLSKKIKMDKKIEKDEKIKQINCKDIREQNLNLNVAGINTYRKPISFQANLNFINTFDFKKDYLILIAGNSETFGVTQKVKNRLHTTLQKKLKKKIIEVENFNSIHQKSLSEKLFVVNLAQRGGMMSDHLTKVLNFAEIYPPDLVIFYTGGNELVVNNIYKKFLKNNILNKNNHKFYSITKSKASLNENFDQYSLNKFNECLNYKTFLTKENFYENHSILDIDEHVKDIFENINKTLTDKLIDYFFYIQPLDEYSANSSKIFTSLLNKKDYVQLHNISISNKNFINLNLSNTDLKLDYNDVYHTFDTEQISTILLNDILNRNEKSILKKISN